MIKHITSRFFSWMTYEPVIGFLMLTAAIVLFIVAYKKDSFKPSSFWEWFRRIIEAGGIAVLFLGLLWGFRAILNDNYKTFKNTHGRVSQVNYESVKKIWGAPHVQRELTVHHYIEKTFEEEIPRADPSKPPLYKVVKRTVEIEQNSIMSSKGKAILNLSERKKGSALYSGFEADFSMKYVVTNDSKETTEARFNFPLSSGQLIYNPFEVLEEGQDISKKLRFSRTSVNWTKTMSPSEKITITVRYKTRGMEYFYYQIPYAREIKDFSFRIRIDQLPVSQINYPEGCLPPAEGGVQSTKDGEGSILEWKFNKTLTSAGMGIALPKPVQPGAKVALVLRNSSYALMLLIITVCLTFLIRGERVNFLELYLLTALYLLLFVTLSSVSDIYIGFWGALVAGSLLTLGLTFLLYRNHHSGVIVTSVLSLVGFFTLIYPLSSLFPESQEAFNGLVVMGVIIYLFWLAWYSRIRKKEEA